LLPVHEKLRKNNNDNGNLGFIHRFIPVDHSRKNDEVKSHVLLLLHGTGGNEEDLIPIGKMISPESAILSPRGKVLENGMPRFFRRLAEGVFDVEDLKYRTCELATFVSNASQVYGFDLNRTIAVGFSNGANIGASMLLLRPEVLSGAILFRAMVPLELESLPDLSEKHIVLSEGLYDPIVTQQEAKKLFLLLEKSRAKISLSWQKSSHNLTQDDILVAKEWFRSTFSST
jgi:phospholipase/carboxylesterase